MCIYIYIYVFIAKKTISIYLILFQVLRLYIYISGAGDGHHQPELRGPSRSSCFRICTIQQRQSPGGLMSGLESHLSHLVHAVYKGRIFETCHPAGCTQALEMLDRRDERKGDQVCRRLIFCLMKMLHRTRNGKERH